MNKSNNDSLESCDLILNLRNKLKKMSLELLNLRLGGNNNQAIKHHKFKLLRCEIARLKTYIKQKK